MNPAPSTAITGYWLTTHANQRLTEMGLTEKQVIAVAKDPAMSYPCRAPGRQMRVGAGIALVIDAYRKAIVTILWDSREKWTL